MVQVLKGAQVFQLVGDLKPWHRQGEQLKIQEPERFWEDTPISSLHLPF
jgi:hypothetical protein